MRVSLMKGIDQWAGGLGCVTLDVVDLLLGRLRSSRLDPEKVRVVLVTKYLGLGSILLAAPMVERLRRLFPRARVVFLTFAENREAAALLGIFDEILTIDPRRLLRLGRDTLAALARLWRQGVDVVCDLEFFTRFSTMVAYLSGARVRVGYFSRIAWRGNLITHPVYYNGMKHITRVFLAQAEVLGARIDEQAPIPARPTPGTRRSRRRATARSAPSWP
jgi:ADP-heptose:LPS heptosyltransferase